MAFLRSEARPVVPAVAGIDLDVFEGTARVFDDEQDALEALWAHDLRSGDVVVIRYEGPAGGPGMREMLAITAAINVELAGATVYVVVGGQVYETTTDAVSPVLALHDQRVDLAVRQHLLELIAERANVPHRTARDRVPDTAQREQTVTDVGREPRRANKFAC